jgi:hypothetical protein
MNGCKFCAVRPRVHNDQPGHPHMNGMSGERGGPGLPLE